LSNNFCVNFFFGAINTDVSFGRLIFHSNHAIVVEVKNVIYRDSFLFIRDRTVIGIVSGNCPLGFTLKNEFQKDSRTSFIFPQNFPAPKKKILAPSEKSLITGGYIPYLFCVKWKRFLKSPQSHSFTEIFYGSQHSKIKTVFSKYQSR
jgi:hypothetical protein